jgi:uncharacterized protein (TIGR02145 family)
MKKLIIPVLVLLLTGCSKELVRYHGHDYKVIKAGSQYWMNENLQSQKYRLGRKIPLVNDLTRWPDLNSPACGYMKSDTALLRKYGMYYNWLAVDGGKLCPIGWRVPTNYDWKILEVYLGGDMRAGGKLKSLSGWKGKHVSGVSMACQAVTGLTQICRRARL